MGGLCRREKNFSHGLVLYWYRQAVRLDWGMYGSFRTFAVKMRGSIYYDISALSGSFRLADSDGRICRGTRQQTKYCAVIFNIRIRKEQLALL